MNGSAVCDSWTAPGAGLNSLLADVSAENTSAAQLEGQAEISFEDLLSEGDRGKEPCDSADPGWEEPAPVLSACPFLWMAVPPPAPPVSNPSPADPRIPSLPEQLAISSAPLDPGDVAEAKQGTPPLAENNFPSIPRGSERSGEQIAANVRNSAPERSGMPVAQGEEMVFTNSNHGEDAAPKSREQALGVEYQPTHEFEPELAPEAKTLRPTRSAPQESLSATVPMGTAIPARLDREAPSFELAPAAETARAATRTLEAIDGHVQLLRSTGQDRLEVVFKPDAVTAIHLEVTRAEGQIQVQARCERGHFAALDAQWSAMQSALAAQGIRLEPLMAGANVGHSGGQFVGGQQGQQNHRDQSDSFLPFLVEQDTPHSGQASDSPSRGWPSRGWQRWA